MRSNSGAFAWKADYFLLLDLRGLRRRRRGGDGRGGNQWRLSSTSRVERGSLLTSLCVPGPGGSRSSSALTWGPTIPYFNSNYLELSLDHCYRVNCQTSQFIHNCTQTFVLSERKPKCWISCFKNSREHLGAEHISEGLSSFQRALLSHSRHALRVTLQDRPLTRYYVATLVLGGLFVPKT